MRFARPLLALVTVALLGWASVADNPAVCPDEVGEQGNAGHEHGTPPTSHCCITAPCHTPTTLQRAALPEAPARPIVATIPVNPHIPTSTDLPAPPTPPPTALD